MFRFTLALVLLRFLPGVTVAFVTAGATLVELRPERADRGDSDG